MDSEFGGSRFRVLGFVRIRVSLEAFRLRAGSCSRSVGTLQVGPKHD